MSKRKLNWLLWALTISIPAPAYALVSPLSLNLFPPLELPPQSSTVTGLRVSALMGRQANVYGFDVAGIGNVTDTNFGGFAVAGGFNYNHGASTITGFQIAGLANVNVNKSNIAGIQIAGLFNSNLAESHLVGFEAALFNYSPYTTVVGAQVGLYNKARVVVGLQIGLLNVTDKLYGVQIGLLNFDNQGLFGIAPILNIGW